MVRKSYVKSSLVAGLVLVGIVCATSIASAGTKAGMRIGMPNPSAVFCIESGGGFDDKNAPAGFCKLPDGQVCEPWAMYRAWLISKSHNCVGPKTIAMQQLTPSKTSSSSAE